MFRVIAEAVATRRDRFVKRYASNSHLVCEICTIYFLSIFIRCATDIGE